MHLRRSDITFPIQLFYDGSCPICMKEIAWLSKHNSTDRLELIDFKQLDFATNHPELNSAQLDQVLHARLGNGRIITGVDATLAAWEAIGKGAFIAPLRWPVFKSIADWAYHLFARNRHTLARRLSFVLGNPACPVQKNKPNKP